jgi:hypothetical protein
MSSENRVELLKIDPIREKHLSNIYSNDGITLDFTDGVVTATSNQINSSQGIKYNKVLVIPKETFWEIIINGAVLGDAKAYIWAQNNGTKERLIANNVDDTVYLNTDTITSVSYVVGGYPRAIKLKFGVYLEDPSIGDQFEIDAMAVIERKSLQLGDWRLYEMPCQLVLDYKKPSGDGYRNFLSYVKGND